MFRASLVLALCSIPAFAQRTSPVPTADPASRPSAQHIDLDSIELKGDDWATNAVELRGMGDSPLVAIHLDRDLLGAVQGNLDRERLERGNGEDR